MQTIGERLEEARKRKGISIREAAEATKIRGDYLQKFESNQFDIGLAEIYVRGFLRSYSLFLRLPAEKVVGDFNALAAGSSPTRRTPNREVYGRMELSVASADDDAGTAQASAQAPASPEGAQGQRAPSSFTRGGGSIPAGPVIDPNLVVKIAVGIIAIVVLGLVGWGIKSMFSGTPPASVTPQNLSTPTAPQQHTMKLTATGPVTVQVETTRMVPAQNGKGMVEDAGDVIFKSTLSAGETRMVPWQGALWVTVTVPKNLQMQFDRTAPMVFGEETAAAFYTKKVPAP